MSRLSPDNLPAFYEYDDVPFLVYTNTDGLPVAVSDLGVISTQTPEIVFEGNRIDGARFTILAQQRSIDLKSGDKYKKVLDFAESLTQPKNSADKSDFLDSALNKGGGNPNHDKGGKFTTGISTVAHPLTVDDFVDMADGIDTEQGGDDIARSIMDKIYAKQGFHAKPTVVSDDKFDDLDSEIYYRSIGEHSNGDKFKEQFKSGSKQYIGTGQYGNGTYVTNKPAIADMYGGGKLIQMAITGKAKSIDYESAMKGAVKLGDAVEKRGNEMLADQSPNRNPLHAVQVINTGRAIKDAGVYSASQGFDYMTIDNPSAPQTLFFNRGMLTVSQDYYTGGTK